MQLFEYPDDVKLIEGLLPESECQKLLAFGETLGYDEAAVDTGKGQELFKAIRNNERILFDNTALAEVLFQPLSAFLPPSIDNWQLKGLNERFRLYKYVAGQYFKWHRDGAFVRDDDQASKLTCLVYLNDDYVGGETEFRGFKIAAKTGAALIFNHPLMHQGATIKAGIKYVLRTDVMYQRIK